MQASTSYPDPGEAPPAGAPAAASAPPPRPRSVVILSAALALAVIAAATFAILFFGGRGTSPGEVGDFLSAESTEVEDRASEVIGLLLTYDATNIEEVAQDMLAISTGNFRQQYEELIIGGTSGAGLGAALEDAAASSRGELLQGPDVSFRSPSEAVAIARVSQTTQSSDNPGGRTIEYVLELTFVDTTDGGWKADRVEVLSQRES